MRQWIYSSMRNCTPMSLSSTHSPFRLLFVLFSALTIVGCSSTGYKKAEGTASKITQSRTELTNASRQIDTTLNSLTSLISADSTNADVLFKQFSTNITAIETQAAKVRKTIDSMNTQGAAYFAAWEQDSALFQNPDLKAQADKRRIELQKDYAQINAYLEATGEAYRPFDKNLRDVERFLSNDLTPAGRASISAPLQRITTEGRVTQKAIDNAIRVMDEVAAKFIP